MDQLIQNFDNLVRADWINTVLSAAIILVVTAIVARLATRFLRHLLRFNEEKNLPSSSIFVNIARGAIWILGICIILDTSFNVNVSGVIAALGVGGIAISLGFQDTISNLIGGLQVSLMRIVKPGDNIMVGTSCGVVKDVTWRQTTLKNSDGQLIIVPNSIINKTALVHLPPVNQVSVPIVVVADGQRLDEIAHAIERTAKRAASGAAKLTKDPSVSFSEVSDEGFIGSVSFRVADSRTGSSAVDAVVRAIAPLTRPDAASHDAVRMQGDTTEAAEAAEATEPDDREGERA